MNPCRLEDLSGWLRDEALSIADEAHRRVLLEVNTNLNSFVMWPKRAELLWAGCDRTARYHDYPDVLKTLFRQRQIPCDSRSNGPAVMAYRIAEGQRPPREARHDWTIHHLYDGNFPYLGRKGHQLRAVRDGLHFTQSAGLVAIDPIADALAEEYETFAWRLRAEAFILFGYDPEGAFCGSPNHYGFAGEKSPKIWHAAQIATSI